MTENGDKNPEKSRLDQIFFKKSTIFIIIMLDKQIDRIYITMF